MPDFLDDTTLPSMSMPVSAGSRSERILEFATMLFPRDSQRWDVELFGPRTLILGGSQQTLRPSRTALRLGQFLPVASPTSTAIRVPLFVRVILGALARVNGFFIIVLG
jgi:hypothetical protein